MTKGRRGRDVCTTPGCDAFVKGLGLCLDHYHQHWLRLAPPDEPLRWPSGVLERYWSRVDRRGDDECWPWLGPVNEDGYGFFRLQSNRGRSAHRIAYALVAPIPPGCEIDHTCHTREVPACIGECAHRRCVNPAHLEAVDHHTNVRRGGNTAKTHCVHGHPLSGDNLRYGKRGNRVCRTCNIESGRRWRARRVI